MAKTLYSQSGKVEYGIKKYTVDTEADKEALNLRTTKMGSKCYVMDTKKWYILNSSNQWIPFVGEGGSGRSPFNIKGSVATVNDLPTEDNEIGDLYIVQENHGEWVWLTSAEEPNGYWEQLGIDISSESIIQATSQMTSQQAADTLENLGGVASDGGVVTAPVVVDSLSDDDGIRIAGGYNQSNEAYIDLVGTYNDDDVRVGGIASPVNDSDAVNKAYVDANSGGDSLVEITYTELKTLRDGGNLVPGQQYRITDYVCTVANDTEARAVSHPYDIIVTADNVNVLNENARACLHEDDAYYSAQGAQADLSAWELKYCLDNDTNRFAWADATNGKGVVFWLKDDWNNECPYDFKQIQFKRYKVTAYPMSNQLVGKYIQKQHNTNLTNSTSDTVFVYTFSTVINSQYEDASVYNYAYVGYGKMHCCNNKISSCYITDSAAQKLNNITLTTNNGGYQYANKFDFGCESMALLGSSIYQNSFGPKSTKNVLYNANQNTCFGGNVNNVEVAANNNVFHYGAVNICVGGERNVFGAGCSVIRLGIGCSNNVFGAFCQGIDFCTTSSGGTYQNYLSNIEIAPECSFLILYATTSLTNAARNCKILQGVKGTSQSNKLSIELPVGATYCTFIGNNTNGTVKMFNIADFESSPTTITDLTSTSITLAAQANTEYHYGTLTALTISSFPANGKFWIWFTSGATPTTTTGIENFVAEANKRYKITVEDNYATYDSWPYTPA